MEGCVPSPLPPPPPQMYCCPTKEGIQVQREGCVPSHLPTPRECATGPPVQVDRCRGRAVPQVTSLPRECTAAPPVHVYRCRWSAVSQVTCPPPTPRDGAAGSPAQVYRCRAVSQVMSPSPRGQFSWPTIAGTQVQMEGCVPSHLGFPPLARGDGAAGPPAQVYRCRQRAVSQVILPPTPGTAGPPAQVQMECCVPSHVALPPGAVLLVQQRRDTGADGGLCPKSPCAPPPPGNGAAGPPVQVHRCRWSAVSQVTSPQPPRGMCCWPTLAGAAGGLCPKSPPRPHQGMCCWPTSAAGGLCAKSPCPPPHGDCWPTSAGTQVQVEGRVPNHFAPPPPPGECWPTSTGTQVQMEGCVQSHLPLPGNVLLAHQGRYIHVDGDLCPKSPRPPPPGTVLWAHQHRYTGADGGPCPKSPPPPPGNVLLAHQRRYTGADGVLWPKSPPPRPRGMCCRPHST
ncbi:basic salivary proline-rich protein 2-like [Phocoena sinus]|uniref:basic salivary proline-rich protein 2-like n=1 Tax=Phocoena sinus TaxID=42100 RepID=UPI0013C40F41|nr:basic salivary proline-rich protein 2-like [Phocoena sinus]